MKPDNCRIHYDENNAVRRIFCGSHVTCEAIVKEIPRHNPPRTMDWERWANPMSAMISWHYTDGLLLLGLCKELCVCTGYC
jgi:hypothetical protein